MMKARRVMAVLVTLFLAAVAVGTPLDDYIAKPDASYTYSVVNTIDNPLGKRICQFHAKDYDDLYGKGSIDFKRVREAMDDAGYRGWFVMEGTKMPKGVEESCRYDAEYLRTLFPRRV